MMAGALDRPLRGELAFDEPMSLHTSWRVGGHARRYYRPADLEDLAEFLSRLEPDEPLLWIGLGSNLLVGDAGFCGTVIATHGRLRRLSLAAGGVIQAQAGVSCARVARFSVERGLRGAEFLAGIPGTVGGALAMNAGAHGGETWSLVQSVTTLDRGGALHRRTPADFSIGYRQVKGPPAEWFVEVHLGLEAGDPEAGKAEIRRLLAKRNATQPTRQSSCGSVFRNPPGDFAARLIEAAGLKGYRIGGAMVSPKHANFIVNLDGARAEDILSLIEHVSDTVFKRFGVRLETEVQVVGVGP